MLGLLLDARIRRATDGRRSLDDFMRLAYQRYGGARGYTPDQFRATAEEIAATDLKEWFRTSVSTTQELDSPRSSVVVLAIVTVLTRPSARPTRPRIVPPLACVRTW